MDDREESHAADPIPSLSYGLYGGIAHFFMHDREENHALGLIPSLSLRNQKSGKKLIYTTVCVGGFCHFFILDCPHTFSGEPNFALQLENKNCPVGEK